MVLEKERTLAYRFPALAAQWHPTRNGGLTPDNITAYNGRRVWWMCRKGHEWQTAVYHRAYGCGCPICAVEFKTSFAEQAICYYFLKVTDAENRYTRLGKEVDIYLPRYRIGIEHNGKYYHKGKEKKDAQKIAFFSKKGIRILTVREGDEDYIAGDNITYNWKKKASLNWAIRTLFALVSIDAPPVDVVNDEQRIYDQYEFMEKKNSLARKMPDVAAQWHPSKNGKLTPDSISFASAKRVWWLCSKGHEWQTPPASRQNGEGCPYCAGKRILAGFNDLQTTAPHLAAQWHPTKNADLTPQTITQGTRRRVWWLCPKGHAWDTAPSDRLRGEGCPYCSNKRVLAGYNDLSTKDPVLASQWHPSKNHPLTADMVTPGSDKNVWWQCEKGHEWKSGIGDRTRGNGCPYCSGRSIIPGKTDLGTLNPALAAQWHPTKNGSLTPRQVAPVSGKWAWWQCEYGHEWRAKISNRHFGSGCPTCANHIVAVGFNDLATTHPEIASQWHPTKNGDLHPNQVTRGMRKKIWWTCSKGHEWQAFLYVRTRSTGCPVCYQESRRKPSK